MVRRTLFVEDDADFRELFARVLREALATERLDVSFVEDRSAAGALSKLASLPQTADAR